MKPLLMVLPSKLPFSVDKDQSKPTHCCWSMLPHSHWVLKLPEVSWLSWSQETPPSQPKNHKPSPLMLTTNQVSWFKSSKVKDKWLKTTTCWVNSISMVSHQPQEEFHKLKSHSKSMRTVSWTLLPPIKEHQRMLKSPLPTIKEDSQKIKSKTWLKKLKDSKIKMKKSERELKLKTPLKAIASALSTLLKNKTWKTSLMLQINKLSLENSRKLKTGLLPTKKLTPQNSKLNKRNLKLSSTQLCKKFIKPLEDNQEDKASQEDSQEHHKEPNKEDHQDQLLMKSIDL